MNLRTRRLGIGCLAIAAGLVMPSVAQADEGMYLGFAGMKTTTKVDTTGMTSGTVTEGGIGGMVVLGVPLADLGSG